MGLGNRPYWRDDEDSGGGWSDRGNFGGSVFGGLPRPGRVVKYLLIANIGVFLLQLLVMVLGRGFRLSLVFGATANAWWQVWRYLTFQFLHSTTDIWHIGLNMLGLYMFGTPLEQKWGSRKFLKFYLSCGATAGVIYALVFRWLMPASAWNVPLIGASGGVYGLLLACAVLFPHMRLILVLFPVPIRLAAILIFGAMLLPIFIALGTGGATSGFWSQVAHLGGVLAAVAWIWLVPAASRASGDVREKLNEGAWQRKMDERRKRQAELDRILDKIKHEGLASLSERERRFLQDETKAQQRQERDHLG